jgi:hypothetical protein
VSKIPLAEGVLASFESVFGDDIPRLALDLGAATVGGPLSDAESWLLERASARAETAPRILADLRSAIHEGEDPLGNLFATSIPPASRRATGTFYTPWVIVRSMVDWALDRSPERIVDPGCGSGRFSAEVVRRKRSANVVAIDLDPLACLMTRAALAVLNATAGQVLNADYTSLQLHRHTGRTAFVGNPPYVRHHAIQPASKAWAARTAAARGIKMSGLAGLHAYFFLATAAHAAPDDIGVFITSSEWLDVGYGSGVRQLLLDGLGGLSVSAFDESAVPFREVMTTACITCFAPGSASPGLRFKYFSGEGLPLELDDGQFASRAALARASRWSPFFRAGDPVAGDGATLGTIARVHRGVATGSNDYFVTTRDEARRRGIERWCKPAITRAQEVIQSPGVIRDNPERKLLVDIPADIDRALHPEVDRFLRDGELGEKAPAYGYLASHRTPWWRLGLSAPPPVVASYMARRSPVFASNPDGLFPLNVVHGIYPRESASETTLIRLVEELNNASASYRGRGRTYHGGLEKFEPREMEALPLAFTFSPPDPDHG